VFDAHGEERALARVTNHGDVTRPLTIRLFENQIRNSRAALQRSAAEPGSGGRGVDDVVDFLAPP
jgi:hypothetical protein